VDKDSRTAHLGDADILLPTTFHNRHYRTLGTIALTGRLTLDNNDNPVAIQSTVDITLVDIYIAIELLDLDIGSSRANHIDNTLITRKLCHRELKLITAQSLDNTAFDQRLDNISDDVASIA
jgi:hypothetical protein